MDRRAFLSIVAGSPLVFGLRELLAQESAPDFIDAALKRMKETRRYGVFLVIPEADAARRLLGQGLVDRMPTGSKAGTGGFELFFAHVFACLDSDQASKRVWGAKIGKPGGVLRLLVDPQGKQVAADRVALEVFEDSPEFIASFSAFIHGRDGARLRDHAKEIEKTLADDVKKAAEQLLGGPDDVPKAFAKLGEVADSIAPWLLHMSLEKPESRFSAVMWNYYLRQSTKDPEPVLPFGLKVERVAVEDPCPPCGMAAYRPTAYRFLQFLTK